jgi:hypothetical protein
MARLVLQRSTVVPVLTMAEQRNDQSKLSCFPEKRKELHSPIPYIIRPFLDVMTPLGKLLRMRLRGHPPRARRPQTLKGETQWTVSYLVHWGEDLVPGICSMRFPLSLHKEALPCMPPGR